MKRLYETYRGLGLFILTLLYVCSGFFILDILREFGDPEIR